MRINLNTTNTQKINNQQAFKAGMVRFSTYVDPARKVLVQEAIMPTPTLVVDIINNCLQLISNGRTFIVFDHKSDRSAKVLADDLCDLFMTAESQGGIHNAPKNVALSVIE